MFGHAKAVVDGPVWSLRIQAGGRAQFGGRNTGDRLNRLRAVLGAGDELRPLVEFLTPGGHERFVHQTLGHHHVRHGIDDGHVSSRPQLEVVIGLDVWRAHQVDTTRVDHDELRALA